MVKFSAPEERAVKAVLISKNQKIGVKILYVFTCLLTVTLIYGAISASANGLYTAEELFSDYVFTALTLFSLFCLSIGLFFVNRIVTQKQLNDNGRYSVELSGDSIKVAFPDEPIVEVSLSDVCSVEEYDIFYIIRIKKGKDEIICSKNALTCGQKEAFENFFASFGLVVQKANDKQIYHSFLKKIRRDLQAGLSSIVYSAIACLVVYPCFWLVIKVLVFFVPDLLSSMLMFLLDVGALARILVGFLVLPIGIVCTIVCAVSSMTVMSFPIFLIFIAIKDALKQLDIKKGALSFGAIATGVLAIAVSVLSLLALFSII